MEYQLGSEIQHKDKTWRIIRVVTGDHSLFEDESGIHSILESYIQLKDADGTIDFITFNSEKLIYNGPTSSIKALEPIPWRPVDA